MIKGTGFTVEPTGVVANSEWGRHVLSFKDGSEPELDMSMMPLV